MSRADPEGSGLWIVDTFEDNFVLVKRKGTLVLLGNSSGAPPPLDLLRLGEKNIKICRPRYVPSVASLHQRLNDEIRLFAYIATPEELGHYSSELFSLLRIGAIKVTIHEEYPFTAEGIQRAQKDITSRGTIGKLIVKVASA